MRRAGIYHGIDGYHTNGDLSWLGNDFDLNLQTIDDLHKPALDGIGYQDLIQEQMVGETSVYENGGSINNIKHLVANNHLETS